MVVLRAGQIRVVKNGTTLAQPFLTIPDVDPAGEGGLLSMAFAPDYLTSGRFYVYMVSDDANPSAPPFGPIELREYRRSASNPEVADPATRRTVLTIPHPDNGNHYGGGLQFGPDGMLYASVGDGGGGGDSPDNAENTGRLLGKVLRMDPRKLGAAPYRIPAGNPFAAGGGHPLVWSYGLRNPFRFSFDRQTGALTIGDVGQDVTEEIEFVTGASPGRNVSFGWNTCEGFVQYLNQSQPCTTGTLPVHTYPNPNPGCSSVTGGVVVRDPDLPALAGKYVYGDYCATYLKTLDFPSGSNEATLSVTVPAFEIAAFGEDACGRVYAVLLGGTVRRLEDDAAPGSCELRVTYRPPVGDAAAPPPSRPGPTAAPALTFSFGGARRQRPLRSGNVGIRVRCSAACRVRVPGVLSLNRKGKRIRLRDGKGRRSSAGTLTLKLRLSRTARRELRLALLARKRVSARLTVRVRDSAGKLSQRQRTVRLVR